MEVIVASSLDLSHRWECVTQMFCEALSEWDRTIVEIGFLHGIGLQQGKMENNDIEHILMGVRRSAPCFEVKKIPR